MFPSSPDQAEQWLPIRGYEGVYEVSDLGRVRSLLYGKTRIMRLAPSKHGYLSLRLCSAAGQRRFYVAHLVLETFVGPRPAGAEAAHDDANRQNNRLTNLAWKTPVENAQDKFRTGTQPLGSKHQNAKLTEAEVSAIRQDPRVQRLIASDYRVSESLVSQLKHGKGWNHV